VLSIPIGPASPGDSGAATAHQATPRFHVQVGSFADRQDALALALRLTSMGYAATVGDGPPYAVWVGGYLDRATASHLAENLRQAGFAPTLTSP
jgi:cell division protein FtsN